MGSLQPRASCRTSPQDLPKCASEPDPPTIPHGHCAKEWHAQGMPWGAPLHRQGQELPAPPISPSWLLLRADVTSEIVSLRGCSGRLVRWRDSEATIYSVEECVCLQFQLKAVVSTGPSSTWSWDWVCFMCSRQWYFHYWGWSAADLLHEVVNFCVCIVWFSVVCIVWFILIVW